MLLILIITNNAKHIVYSLVGIRTEWINSGIFISGFVFTKGSGSIFELKQKADLLDENYRFNSKYQI